MLTPGKRIFELSPTYLEFIISTLTKTPVQFSDEETTTFRENTRLQNSVFLNKLIKKKQ